MPLSQPSAKLYRGRVADQIVEDLRSQILSGALPDGTRLPSERELAAHYDVSGRIREAVRVLAAMGLLNTRQPDHRHGIRRHTVSAVHRLSRRVREDERYRRPGPAGSS